MEFLNKSLFSSTDDACQRPLKRTGWSLSLLMTGMLLGVTPVSYGAPSCTNPTQYHMNWKDFTQFNDNADGSSGYPFVATATGVDGSNINISATIPRFGSDALHVNFPNTEFPGLIDSYLPDPQVYRFWRQNDDSIDTLVYNFSESVVLDTFMFGGQRPPTNGTTFAYAELTFWDGLNGTGNKVVSTHANGPGSVANINAGDASTDAINVLQGQYLPGPIDIGSGASFLTSGNSYVGMGFDKDTRPWTVLQLNGVEVRSITWSEYASSEDISTAAGTPDSAVARGALVNSGNLSAYISNFNFGVCEAPPVVSCDTGSGHFGGTVFRDRNSDGGFDVSETGFGVTGMQVKAYDASNTAAETATVGSDGKYVFTSLANGTDYRLEFTGLPNYLQSTAEGANADASVRFVNTTSCNLDFGVHNPAQFCQSNPNAATTCFINGDPAHAGSPADTLVSFDYAGTSKSTIGFKAETGSTWGVAYDSKRDQLYTAAVLRRHTGMGPAGAGGIYAIAAPASATPGAASEFYNLTDFSVSVGTVPDNTARELVGLAPTDLNHDALAFPLIGKAGLGDLELSNDGDTLYVTNLADKKIYTIDLNNPAAAPSTLPDFPATTCNNGEARPWALKVRDDQLYLGVVCSAETAAGTTADLNAYVYAYNGSSWSTAINNFALDYPREAAVVSPNSPGAWTPWRDTVADFSPPNNTAFGKPTPILSDIEFDDQGNMILGFLDRTGIQFGALNWGTGSDESTRYQIASGGDILKATPNNDGTYTVENITVAADEFYDGEKLTGKHMETAQGGLAVLPGSDQVMTVGMDPLTVNTGGIFWFNNTTGAKDHGFQLYSGRAAQGLSGKAVGLGDIELLCESAALEIGNRLWCDTNTDGIQTPGELGVGAGVDVTLKCGAESATVSTDADGKYLFTDVNWAAAGTTTSDQIPRATACTIVVDYSSASPAIATACSYSAVSPTTPNAGSDNSNSAHSDVRDSDGTDTGTQASISFTTGQSGENNHSLDFGFKDESVTISLDLGDAPDAAYPTLLANDGPRHTLDTALYLGACVDDEADGQPATNADGDDVGVASANTLGACATANDDEDSLTPPTLTDEQVAPTVTVATVNTTGADAYLACWVDYSGSGFEAGERSATVTVANNANSAVVTLPDVPVNASTATSGSSFMRCRLASTEAEITDPTGAATDGEIEDYPITVNAIPVVSLDLGDAPSADYPTLLADTGPSHGLDTALYLGACVDDEADGQPTAGADGDDISAASANTVGTCATANDDEDSLTPPTLTDEQVAPTVTVATVNTTGADAYLACWVDYSGSGFEAGERSATVTVVNNATSVVVSLPDVPVNASTATSGSSFMRCRLASTEAEITDPTGTATDGEIEDYPITVNAIPVVSLDLGDAPSTDYPTLLADAGPSHGLDTALYLGACVDDEADGQPTAGADGDDISAASANTVGTCATANDDEDSLTPPTLTDEQVAPTVTVATVNTTGADAYLACWVDYSGSGFEAGERSATVTVANNANSAVVTLPDVPVNASTVTSGSSFMRCRLASTEAEITDPTGAAIDGEIEDYPVAINTKPVIVVPPVYDFGDAPDSYGTNLNNDGAQHRIVNGLKLGTIVDDESNGSPGINAAGDDSQPADRATDEDGVVIPTLIDGQALTLNATATNTTGNLAKLICWIDYNGDGVFAANGNESGSATVANGSNNAVIAVSMPIVPATASSDTNGSTYARCRLSTDGLTQVNPTGFANDGEVEDYPVTINAKPVIVVPPIYDFGDAPDTYGTTPGSNGAGHLVVPGLRMGLKLDEETAGLGTDTASGDGADEDGVVIPDLVDNGVVSLAVTVTNNTGSDANLVCWIDYNGDGVFATDGSESGSQVIASLSNNVNVSVVMPPVPATSSQDTNGVTYARCRLTTDPISKDDPTGLANDGEVEDYRVSVRAPAIVTPPSTGVQPIPTLSEWMLIMLSSLMALLGWKKETMDGLRSMV